MNNCDQDNYASLDIYGLLNHEVFRDGQRAKSGTRIQARMTDESIRSIDEIGKVIAEKSGVKYSTKMRSLVIRVCAGLVSEFIKS